MADQRPIGIFDSGVGGLTVASAVSRLLPEESIIYFGDTRHAPYGDKSDNTILEYAKRITRFLVDKECKVIVIACNSASAVAAEVLPQIYPQIPIINVVDPTVAYLVGQKAQKVGLIATRATVRSGVYPRRLLSLIESVEIAQKATPLLAPLVEEGFANTQVSRGALEHYLNDEKLQGLSHLILGCTHYPLLQKEIEAFFKGQTEVLNSADLVAQGLKEVLEEKGLQSDLGLGGSRAFYLSEKTEAFAEVAQLFFGEQLEINEQALLA